MPSVEAGWALLGKRPGTSDDYGVIAASRWLLSAAQFQDLIFRYDPGNPSLTPGSAAEALPWVTFSGLIVDGRPYLTVAVREWSEHVDRDRRPVAFTRCFCLPLEAADQASVTFTDLYYAVLDRHPAWDVPRPLHGDPVVLTLPAADDPKAAGVGMPEGAFLYAAAAAGAILEGAVAVLDAPPELLDRLRFLDAAASLLPGGTRAWLSASTWADSSTRHRLRLAFTRRGRAGDRQVALRGAAGGPQEEVGQTYAKELVRLTRDGNATGLTRYLGARRDVRDPDPAVAAEALVEFDLPGVLVRSVHDGTLRVQRVRRLGELNRVRELTPEDLDLVLCAYLYEATSVDVRTDVNLLAAHWTPKLTWHLEYVTRLRLWRRERPWKVTALTALAVLADRVGARPAVLGGLMPEEPHAYAEYARAAEFVTELVTSWGRPAVLPAVGRDAPLAVAVVIGAVRTDPALARDWVAGLDKLGGKDRAGWDHVAAPFRAALLGHGTGLDRRHLQILDDIDPTAGPDLMTLQAQRSPDEPANGFLAYLQAALDFLAVVVHGGMAPPVLWLTALENTHAGDDQIQARTDLQVYLAGRVPRVGPADAVHDAHGPRDGYVTAFVQQAWATDLDVTRRRRLVRDIACRLQPGWGEPDSRFGAVVDLLWGLSQPPNSSERIADDHVESTVIAEVQHQIHLLRHPSFEQWWGVIRAQRPELTGPILLAELRAVRPDTPVSTIADSVVELLTVASKHDDDVVRALHGARYRPTLDDLVHLLATTPDRLERAGYPRPYAFVHRFGREVLNGHFGRELADRAGTELPALYARQVAHSVTLLHAVASAKGNAHAQTALREFEQLLGTTLDTFKSVFDDGHHGRASWWSRRSKDPAKGEPPRGEAL